MATGRIFHLIYYGYEKTVIDSQVVAPALQLHNEGINVELIFFESIRTWISLLFPIVRNSWRQRLSPISFFVFPRVPRNFLSFNTLILQFFLIFFAKGASSFVFHCRGFQGTSVAIPLKKGRGNLKVICDARGVEAEEFELTATEGGRIPLSRFAAWWKKRLDQITQSSLAKSDQIFHVSRALRKYLEEKFAVSGKEWLYVPTAIHVKKFSNAIEKRDALRRELRLEDRLITVFSGAIHPWQTPEPAVRLFMLMREIDARFYFLALSPQGAVIEKVLKDNKIETKDYRVLKVSYSEMPSYLAMSDVGLLLREPSPVNYYSSPTKFAEFLAAGMRVLVSSTVYDAAAYVSESQTGYIVPSGTNEYEYSAQIHAMAKELSKMKYNPEQSVQEAERVFDWSNYLPRIRQIYADLSKSK